MSWFINEKAGFICPKNGLVYDAVVSILQVFPALWGPVSTSLDA
jgi:hypothetical protein